MYDNARPLNSPTPKCRLEISPGKHWLRIGSHCCNCSHVPQNATGAEHLDEAVAKSISPRALEGKLG